MKTLLVNNGSLLLKELSQHIPGEVTTIPWDQVGLVNAADFDRVILSGGSMFSVAGNEKKLKDELRLIRADKKPLIGICFGCELIADAFGGVLERMPSDHKGEVRIIIDPAYGEFFGVRGFTSYEHHVWRIREVPPDFVVMAASEHGPELICHKELPIFGLQFHPEKVIEGATGMEIFKKILTSVIPKA